MSTAIADPVELRARGFAVLVAELGWVNAVRFIHQYERGVGDYTRERADILPEWGAKELVDAAQRIARR